MNFDVRVLSERSIGTGRVAGRVRVAVGRGIRQAHVVGGRGILASGQVARVVVVHVGIGTPVGASGELNLRKQISVAVAVNVARANQASAIVVIGVIVHVLVVNKVVERRAGRNCCGSLTSCCAANVIRR